ncbi:MAG: hypothetical protein ACLR17_03445 [Enterobacteriaceae bacterium]
MGEYYDYGNYSRFPRGGWAGDAPPRVIMVCPTRAICRGCLTTPARPRAAEAAARGDAAIGRESRADIAPRGSPVPPSSVKTAPPAWVGQIPVEHPHVSRP